MQAVGNIAYIIKIRTTSMRDQGACLSPFNSFLLLQGLETLSLRVKRHVKDVGRVVDFLQKRPKIAAVYHPSLAQGGGKELYERYYPKGGASIFTFEIEGSEEQARAFMESLSVFSLLAGVADMESLVIHPASATHSQISTQELAAVRIISQTVRFSIGTEHIDDVLEGLRQGFTAILAGK